MLAELLNHYPIAGCLVLGLVAGVAHGRARFRYIFRVIGGAGIVILIGTAAVGGSVIVIDSFTSINIGGVMGISLGSGIGILVGPLLRIARDRRTLQATSPTPARDSEPPLAAQYVLELLAPAGWDEAVAGDFFERYERKFRRVAGKHGVLLANVDYWWQMMRAAPGLLRIRFRYLAVLAGVVKLLDGLQRYWTAR